MTKTEEHILEEAFAWIIRLRQANVDEWEKFTRWLEADRAHLLAYEEAAALDAELDDLPREQKVMPVNSPPRSERTSRRAVLGWSVAAALVAMVGYSSFSLSDSTYVIETAPGERRSIALEAGGAIYLNGASRIVLDRSDVRFSRLERGEALFKVVHDPSTSFRVEVAGGVIQNVGTVFNVLNEDDLVQVEVAEGKVLYKEGGQEVSLSQGETLRQKRSKLITGERDPAEIGAWREGQLSYSSASIAEVAADLSRYTGLVVRASPEVADQRFSGVIMLDSNGLPLLRRASALLSVDVRPAGEGWLLTRTQR